METKPCTRCGTTDRYKSGRCKRCQSDNIKRYRARQRGDAPPVASKPAEAPAPKPTPKPAQKTVNPPTPVMAPQPAVNLAEELSTSKRRLSFVIQRHQQTINDL